MLKNACLCMAGGVFICKLVKSYGSFTLLYTSDWTEFLYSKQLSYSCLEFVQVRKSICTSNASSFYSLQNKTTYYYWHIYSWLFKKNVATQNQTTCDCNLHVFFLDLLLFWMLLDLLPLWFQSIHAFKVHDVGIPRCSSKNQASSQLFLNRDAVE